MKKLLIFIIIILVAIVILFVLILSSGKKPAEKKMAEEPGPTPLNIENLLGKWTAISEEVRGTKTKDLENYSITFNNDGTYSSVVWGIPTNGKYKLEGDKILFYGPEEDLDKTEGLSEVWVKLENNTLTLTFPEYPKIVVYQK